MKDICIEKVVNVYFKQQSNWKRTVFAPRGYDALVLFTQGKIEYNFANKTVVAQKGDLLLLPGNLPYSGKKHTPQVGYYVIDFACGRAEEFSELLAPAVVSNQEALCAVFSGALEQWQRQPIHMQLHLKSLVYGVLSGVFETCGYQPTARTEEILSFISENLGDSKLSVAALCRRFYISESQLRRNLQKATGLTPNSYITTLRINRAKSELLHTTRSIKAVSQGCGFSSPCYFSRCFAQATGLSPTEYRKTAV